MSSENRRACEGCEVLPIAQPVAGTLYLAPPLTHTYGVLKGLFHRYGLAVDESIPNTLAVTVVAGQLATVADELTSTLTSPELDGTPALVMPPGAVPAIADFLRARPLTRLIAQVRGEWLTAVIAEDRLTTHFQPIVNSVDPADVFAYECLSRGIDHDGKLIYPGKLYPSATNAGILFHLDRATRIRAIRAAAEQGISGYIFINFSPSSIYNPDYCLRSTARAAKEAGVAPEQVVFEVVESEEVRDVEHLLAILKVYRDAGFRVALDDLGSGFSSLNLLHRLRPDFIKLDMDLVRNVDTDSIKGAVAAKLLEAAAMIGIPTIAEGVETGAEWQWLRDHGASYQQGYLFAKPASPAPRPISPIATAMAAD